MAENERHAQVMRGLHEAFPADSNFPHAAYRGLAIAEGVAHTISNISYAITGLLLPVASLRLIQQELGFPQDKINGYSNAFTARHAALLEGLESGRLQQVRCMMAHSALADYDSRVADRTKYLVERGVEVGFVGPLTGEDMGDSAAVSATVTRGGEDGVYIHCRDDAPQRERWVQGNANLVLRHGRLHESLWDRAVTGGQAMDLVARAAR